MASTHPAPELLAEAVYGLTEFARDDLAQRTAGCQSRLLYNHYSPCSSAHYGRPS